MKKVLVNIIHPNLNESRVNKTLIEEISQLPNVTVNDLYKEYGDFKIDEEKEQALLLEHDVIVLQFPLYWFSSPSLLKEWLDVVLAYDFAYGNAFKLEGKTLVIATSAGASKKEYEATSGGIEAFLLPFFGTTNYTKMNYGTPFVTYETFVLNDEELKQSAMDYVTHIKELLK